MTVAVRLARSEEDYLAWRVVRLAVVPRERVDSAQDLRAQAGPQGPTPTSLPAKRV
jgi:hypothetical protein